MSIWSTPKADPQEAINIHSHSHFHLIQARTRHSYTQMQCRQQPYAYGQPDIYSMAPVKDSLLELTASDGRLATDAPTLDADDAVTGSYLS